MSTSSQVSSSSSLSLGRRVQGLAPARRSRSYFSFAPAMFKKNKNLLPTSSDTGSPSTASSINEVSSLPSSTPSSIEIVTPSDNSPDSFNSLTLPAAEYPLQQDALSQGSPLVDASLPEQQSPKQPAVVRGNGHRKSFSLMTTPVPMVTSNSFTAIGGSRYGVESDYLGLDRYLLDPMDPALDYIQPQTIPGKELLSAPSDLSTLSRPSVSQEPIEPKSSLPDRQATPRSAPVEMRSAPALEPKKAPPEPSSKPSKWKSWLRRKTDRTLTADPLAGDIPSSVSDADSVVDSIAVSSRPPSPLPPALNFLRTISVTKMRELRAASPHPFLGENDLPKYSDQRRLDRPPALRYPRSVNRVRKPGMSLGPAQAGMRIDVGVRAILRKVDNGPVHGNDVEHIIDTLQSRSKTYRRDASGQQGEPGPGLLEFVKRAAFEERVRVWTVDGSSFVESAGGRPVYEIEYSEALEASAKEAADRWHWSHHRSRRMDDMRIDVTRSMGGRTGSSRTLNQTSSPPMSVSVPRKRSASSDTSIETASSGSQPKTPPVAVSEPTPPSAFDLGGIVKSITDIATPSSELSKAVASVARGSNDKAQQPKFPTGIRNRATWQNSASSESDSDEEESDENDSLIRPPMHSRTISSPAFVTVPVGDSVNRPITTTRRQSTDLTGATQSQQDKEKWRKEIAAARSRRESSRMGSTEREYIAGSMRKIDTRAPSRGSSSGVRRSYQSQPSSPLARNSHLPQSMSSVDLAEAEQETRRKRMQRHCSFNDLARPAISTFAPPRVPRSHSQARLPALSLPASSPPMLPSMAPNHPMLFNLPGAPMTMPHPYVFVPVPMQAMYLQANQSVVPDAVSNWNVDGRHGQSSGLSSFNHRAQGSSTRQPQEGRPSHLRENSQSRVEAPHRSSTGMQGMGSRRHSSFDVLAPSQSAQALAGNRIRTGEPIR